MRAVVGMSGGVDSSLAAACAVEAGFEAVGVGVRQLEGASRCCSLADARRVCEELGMRFYAVDRVDAFRREVMEPFADGYLRGQTPIPCVSCNRTFKFDVLLARARAFGAERVVTGHFARVDSDPETGRRRLLRGRDRTKDQSYFLFQLDQEALARAWFPLGEMTKAEVREAARRRGLHTADKPESQEICFVPGDDYAAVVEGLRPGAARPGAVIDEDGAVLGRHDGIHRFTVGQRRGLGVAAGRRVYVTSVDAETGTVRVGPPEALEVREVRVRDVSWTGEPPVTRRVEVQVRYRQEPVKAHLTERGQEILLELDAPVSGLSAGQAAVVYDGDVVLGGGFVAGAGP